MAAFVMFSSCGGNTGGKVAQEDSLVIDTVATLEQDTTEDVQTQLTETLQSGDAAQVQAAIEKVAGEVQAAIQSGDQQTAEKYASQIKAFVEQNADKLKALDVNTLTVGNLIDAAKNLPANAKQTAKAGEKADQAVQDATDKAKKKLGL